MSGGTTKHEHSPFGRCEHTCCPVSSARVSNGQSIGQGTTGVCLESAPRSQFAHPSPVPVPRASVSKLTLLAEAGTRTTWEINFVNKLFFPIQKSEKCIRPWVHTPVPQKEKKKLRKLSGCMAQEVEYLLSKCEALSLNPSTTKTILKSVRESQ
jgi:hypothetical protein